MPALRPSPGCRLGALATVGLAALPLAAQAELRPAVLPDEICLVLQNGPFDATIAARIAGRDDFAAILLSAETNCPELAEQLIGATATIPTPDTVNVGTDGNPNPVTPTVPSDPPPLNPPPEEPPPDEPPPEEPPPEEPPIDTNPPPGPDLGPDEDIVVF